MQLKKYTSYVFFISFYETFVEINHSSVNQ